jgi:hypothetical protein
MPYEQAWQPGVRRRNATHPHEDRVRRLVAQCAVVQRRLFLNGMSDGANRRTVSAAARMWEVEPQTVHKWINTGLLPNIFSSLEGKAKTAPEKALRTAKVLLASHLENKFGIRPESLADAERKGRVQSCDGRYSLEDLAVLDGSSARVVASAPEDAVAGHPKPPRPSREAYLELLRDLVRQGTPYADYPGPIFDSEECPQFSPPRPDLFAYGLGQYVPSDRPMAVWITRSTGWGLDASGILRWFEATPRHALERRPLRDLPGDMASDTLLYRAFEVDWRHEWARRRAR